VGIWELEPEPALSKTDEHEMRRWDFPDGVPRGR